VPVRRSLPAPRERLSARLFAQIEAFGAYDADINDAKKVQHGAQVGFLMIKRLAAS
jgi:hypothetical protein